MQKHGLDLDSAAHDWQTLFEILIYAKVYALFLLFRVSQNLEHPPQIFLALNVQTPSLSLAQNPNVYLLLGP